MVASVRVGSAHVTVGVDARRYESGINRAVASTHRLTSSVVGIQRTLDRFSQSVTASLIATLAYAAGVNAIRAAIGGSLREFLQWERGLINIAKTTGLTTEETEKLGRQLQFLNTGGSVAGRPLAATTQSLTDIATTLGQGNVLKENIAGITEVIALLGETTDLAAREAAEAFILITKNTQATEQDVLSFGNVLTALGNEFRGGESGLISYTRRLAAATAQFNLSTQFLLSLSAVMQQVGLRSETSATAIQRSIVSIINAATQASQGDLNKLGVIFQDLELNGVPGIKAVRTEVDQLIDSIQRGNFEEVFVNLIEALDVASPSGDVAILTTLFGGVIPPARITEILGSLANNIDEIRRALALSNKEWESGNALLAEAELSLAAFDKRFAVVGNEIKEQAKGIGAALAVPAIAVAENWRTVEAVFVGLAASLTGRFLRNQVIAGAQSIKQSKASASAAVGAAEVQLASAKERQSSDNDLIRSTTRHEKSRQGSFQRGLRNRKVEIASDRSRLSSFRNTNRSLQQSQQKYDTLTEKARSASNNQIRQGFYSERRIVAARIKTLSKDATERNRIQTRLQGNLTKQSDAERGLRSSQKLTNNQIIQRDNALGRVQQRTETVAASQAVYNQRLRAFQRAGRLSTGVLRGLRGAFNFFGGGLGLTIGLLAAGTLAWRNYNSEIVKGREAFDNIVSSVDRATEAINRQNSGLTQTGFNVQKAVIELKGLRNELAEVESKLPDAVRRFGTSYSDALIKSQRGGGGLFTSEARRAQVLIDRIEILETSLENYENVAGDLPTIFSFEGGVKETTREAERINSLLDSLPAKVHAFNDSLSDLNSDRLEDITFDLGQVSQTTFYRDIFSARREIRKTVRNEIRRLQRQLLNQREELANIEGSINRAELVLADPTLRFGTTQYKEAQKELSRLEQLEFNLSQQVEETEAILEIRRRLNYTNQQLAAEDVVIAQRNLDLDRIFAEPGPLEIPNFATARLEADSLINRVRQSINQNQRQSDQQLSITQVDSREAAGLRERYRVENQFLEAQLEIRNRLLEITNKETAARQRLLQLQEQFETERFGSDRKVQIANEIKSTENLINTLERQGKEAKITKGAISDLKEEMDALAESQSEFAQANFQGPLAQLALEANKFGDALENVTTNSLMSFETELLSIFKDGKFDVVALAEVIAVDLIRALVRATITANLAKVALSFLPGLSPASTGLPNFGYALAHDGGIPGYSDLPLRSARSGIKSDEIFAVLRRGEEVIKRNDPRHRWNFNNTNADVMRRWVSNLPRYHEGGIAGNTTYGGGSKGGLVINLVNESSSQLEAVDNGQRFDGEAYVRSVILRDARRNGTMTQSLRRSVLR